MDDFTVMAKILAAIKVCEQKRSMNMALFDPKALKSDERTRDGLIVKLQDEGYVDGFMIIDDIDNQPYPIIVWQNSNPRITIKGMTFIRENQPLRKAIEEIKKIAVAAATAQITGMIFFL